jgi:beta-phosphoglucomutase-like phosphatase (HAD superfamily)
MKSEKLAEYLDAGQAAEMFRSRGDATGATEFVRVRNIDYVYAPCEIYPLAPRVRLPMARIGSITVDMDGTSTTTEPLALHSLEYMVRRFTGLRSHTDWPGLDAQHDHPHVIGNSNFRHTEFLVRRYRDRLDTTALAQGFFEAVGWTLANMDDPERRRIVQQNAVNCGLGDLLRESKFHRLVDSGVVSAENVGHLLQPFVGQFGGAFRCDAFGQLVGAALDIYYMRYHSILRQLEQGAGARLSQELLGDSGRNLVEPMPGYDVFLPLVRGWLGPESNALYEMLRDSLLSRPDTHHTAAELDRYRHRLGALAEHFRRHPAKVALVTASIAYETHTTMKEVVRVMRQRIEGWPIPASSRDALLDKLSDHRAGFDAFICASDACEHRLKPHPDLYSLALREMGIPKADYAGCVGLEDTEPGIIALRAAGIGAAIALPNHDTSRQDYAAATRIISGGLPELILVHNLLLDEG